MSILASVVLASTTALAGPTGHAGNTFVMREAGVATSMRSVKGPVTRAVNARVMRNAVRGFERNQKRAEISQGHEALRIEASQTEIRLLETVIDSIAFNAPPVVNAMRSIVKARVGEIWRASSVAKRRAKTASTVTPFSRRAGGEARLLAERLVEWLPEGGPRDSVTFAARLAHAEVARTSEALVLATASHRVNNTSHTKQSLNVATVEADTAARAAFVADALVGEVDNALARSAATK
jgi:hypothetical protein